MHKHITPLLVMALVTGCTSSMERRQASGNKEYVNAESVPQLTIPAGLKQPNFSREYNIPQLASDVSRAQVGDFLDIRPPLQVLPLAEGTRVEEGADKVKVIIEAVDNSVDLKQEIFGFLKDYLASRQIEVQNANFDSGILETGWIENRDELESSLLGSDKVFIVKQRYRYQVEVRPHGRTGAILIDLIEHQERYDGDIAGPTLSSDVQRRYLVDSLNSAIAYIASKREQAIQAKRRRDSLGIGLELVDGDADADAFYLAKGDFNHVWARLRLVLPEMGFEIADMDSNKGIYFLNYSNDGGFWSSLWGDSKPDLKKGSYKLKVTSTEDRAVSKLFMLDKEDKPVADDKMVQIYSAMAKLMQEERSSR